VPAQRDALFFSSRTPRVDALGARLVPDATKSSAAR